DVYVAARDAELGAVVLAPVARHVELASPDPSAQTWYGPASDIGERDVAIVDATNRERPEVAGARVVIDVDARDGGVRIEPAPVVPVDSLFDFSGRVQRKESPFSVFIRNDRALRKPVVPDRAAVGGSSGHIVFGLRGRALQHGGADVDLAQALAGAMQDEGFTVDVVDDPQVAAALRPDLIHAFGLADATAAAQYLRVAKNSDVPFALHPLYDAPALGGYWGATVTPYCFRFMQDEVTVENLCELMRNRRLAVNAIVADSMYHPTQPRWAEDVRTVVGEADALFVAGPQEAAAMREIVRAARTVELPPPVGASVEPEAIAALVGSQSYALMHAPIEATQNQLMAVRAAELAEIPLVIAGPVTDADYAALVRAFAGERVILLGEPGPALLEGLYRGADLYVDIAWVGCGPARAARAVSRGASLVLSQRTPWEDLGLEEFVRAVNPGDVQAIARGMGDMWTVRQHEEARFEEIRLRAVAGWGVRDVTTAMVAAYAGTLEKRNQPVMR
ncbi:MAG: hypothetical protein JO349_10085, partial [Candidatus Eremiobacteraeota bacterium]|nr:hypothetical protein [Candidatus Eremiobacteraeota bacterium]